MKSFDEIPSLSGNRKIIAQCRHLIAQCCFALCEEIEWRAKGRGEEGWEEGEEEEARERHIKFHSNRWHFNILRINTQTEIIVNLAPFCHPEVITKFYPSSWNDKFPSMHRSQCFLTSIANYFSVKRRKYLHSLFIFRPSLLLPKYS